MRGQRARRARLLQRAAQRYCADGAKAMSVTEAGIFKECRKCLNILYEILVFYKVAELIIRSQAISLEHQSSDCRNMQLFYWYKSWHHVEQQRRGKECISGY